MIPPDKELRKLGLLAHADTTETELRLLLAFFGRLRRTPNLDFLRELVGSRQLFEMLDVLSGQTIKLPRRDEILRMLVYIRIYLMIVTQVGKPVPADEVPSEVIAGVAHAFSRRKNSIKRVYAKVHEVLQRTREDV